MIITCKCGEKKFTLPDNSIPVAGRMVQCGFCGLKWKQFPLGEVEKTQSIARPKDVVSRPRPVQQNIQKPKKVRKTAPKKPREISLYSPEYLAKKHGININDTQPKKQISKEKKEKVVSENVDVESLPPAAKTEVVAKPLPAAKTNKPKSKTTTNRKKPPQRNRKRPSQSTGTKINKEKRLIEQKINNIAKQKDVSISQDQMSKIIKLIKNKGKKQ